MRHRNTWNLDKWRDHGTGPSGSGVSSAPIPHSPASPVGPHTSSAPVPVRPPLPAEERKGSILKQTNSNPEWLLGQSAVSDSPKPAKKDSGGFKQPLSEGVRFPFFVPAAPAEASLARRTRRLQNLFELRSPRARRRGPVTGTSANQPVGTRKDPERRRQRRLQMFYLALGRPRSERLSPPESWIRKGCGLARRGS